MSSQRGSHNLLQGLMTYLSILNKWFMPILSKECEPDNFESHHSLKLTFFNIWGLRLNFVDCESCLQSNPSDILAL